MKKFKLFNFVNRPKNFKIKNLSPQLFRSGILNLIIKNLLIAMAVCIVTSCRSNNCELFCAPDDKNKLKKWQMTVGTKESEFLICERHFQKEFIITEKSLASNAFPSLFLKSQDFHKDSTCQSCLKQLSNNEDRKLTGQSFVDIFKKLGFEVSKS